MFEKFGWNAGQKFLDWFGNVLLQKCGNADITFQEVSCTITLLQTIYIGIPVLTLILVLFQLHKKTGKELCIVAVNVNRMKAEYFHPKTTPDVVIRQAVLMTISVPGNYGIYSSIFLLADPTVCRLLLSWMFD